MAGHCTSPWARGVGVRTDGCERIDQECGGIKITEEAHHKEVAGLSQERIDSLTKHMKPMKHKDAGGMYRSPAEVDGP